MLRSASGTSLGVVPLSSTSCIRHSRQTARPGRWRTLLELSHARQLTTARHQSSQDPTQTACRRLTRHVRTLDPNKLSPSDYIDLSTRHQPDVTFIVWSPDPKRAQMPLLGRVSGKAFPNERFPPNATGFLYYHIPPHSPPLAGEVRFRIIPSPDPASFAAGTDLLMDHGVPWKIPLLYMSGIGRYTGLRTLLLQDELITPQLLDIATSAAATLVTTDDGRKVGLCTTAIVSSFGRGFNFQLGIKYGTWLTIGKDTVLRRRVQTFGVFRVPVDGIDRTVKYFPYEGSHPWSTIAVQLTHHTSSYYLQALLSAVSNLRRCRNMPADVLSCSVYCISSTATLFN